MTIEQTVTIPADHRLHFDFEVPPQIPAGRARAALTLTYEEEQERPAASDWVNPLLGMAKAKGATLTLERFLEMQQEEVKHENENDRRLSLADAVGVATAIERNGVFVTADHHELEAIAHQETLNFFWFR